MATSHTHPSPITHRIQVHDDDLDPALNEGALYFSGSYYNMFDDIDQMNSAAWKQTTINSGTPGGHWYFGMSGVGTMPNIGFAIDAWEGAYQTVIAQEVPVIHPTSPDGRCILAVKVTDLGNNKWHYEYALLNIDMDRQVGSFTIPIQPGTNVTNVEFYAPFHHDEQWNVDPDRPDAVEIDNAPWTSTVTADSVSWSTTTNPLRWYTVHNFRFDANAPSTRDDAVVGLFRPGTPSTLLGGTFTPGTPVETCDEDCDGSNDYVVDILDFLEVLAQWGEVGGSCDMGLGDPGVGINEFLAILAAWGPCP
jgi:hypothetical protein